MLKTHMQRQATKKYSRTKNWLLGTRLARKYLSKKLSRRSSDDDSRQFQDNTIFWAQATCPQKSRNIELTIAAPHTTEITINLSLSTVELMLNHIKLHEFPDYGVLTPSRLLSTQQANFVIINKATKEIRD